MEEGKKYTNVYILNIQTCAVIDFSIKIKLFMLFNGITREKKCSEEKDHAFVLM